MDKTTRREWELFDTDNELFTLDDLKKFLKERCDLLEKLEVFNNSYSKDLNNKGNRSFNKGNKADVVLMLIPTSYQNQ